MSGYIAIAIRVRALARSSAHSFLDCWRCSLLHPFLLQLSRPLPFDSSSSPAPPSSVLLLLTTVHALSWPPAKGKEEGRRRMRRRTRRPKRRMRRRRTGELKMSWRRRR
eukprot:8837218-Pyramimonas_sp.AAC.1